MRPIPLPRQSLSLSSETSNDLCPAIKKPPSLSSAQVLRDLQHKFADSETFAPLLQQAQRHQEQTNGHQRKRRRVSSDNVFKMGHGGTLDPLATGVLIVGIGRGTKSLSDFLGCTKDYETVVLFGKSTDTYDVAGKVVAEAPHRHITRELVEDKLTAFRGHIKQVPPIYSALKFQGIPAYEYARSGKELPRELESRNMKVDECEIVEWYEAGTHDYRWPASEVSPEDKEAARKLIRAGNPTVKDGVESDASGVEKVTVEDTAEGVDAPRLTEDMVKPSSASIDALNKLPPSVKAAMHTHDGLMLSEAAADAAAVRVRLTVSSGFYVRSFAHDLGIACESYGTMSELARNRQEKYTTLDHPPSHDRVPCLTYEQLEAGEDVWGPLMSDVLSKWLDENPAPEDGQRHDDRDYPPKQGQRNRPDFRRGHGTIWSEQPQQRHHDEEKKQLI